MKKGTKKYIAKSEFFNDIQGLRGGLEDHFDVQNPRWCGFWNGMNWSQFSFYCTPQTLQEIKNFCLSVELNITFE